MDYLTTEEFISRVAGQTLDTVTDSDIMRIVDTLDRTSKTYARIDRKNLYQFNTTFEFVDLDSYTQKKVLKLLYQYSITPIEYREPNDLFYWVPSHKKFDSTNKCLHVGIQFEFWDIIVPGRYSLTEYENLFTVREYKNLVDRNIIPDIFKKGARCKMNDTIKTINKQIPHHNDYIDVIGTQNYVFPMGGLQDAVNGSIGHKVDLSITTKWLDSNLKPPFNAEKPYFAITDSKEAVSLSEDEALDYLLEFAYEILSYHMSEWWG